MAVDAVARAATDAGRRFLDSFDADALARLSFGFGGPERRAWHYVPTERPGVRLGELDPAQRELLDGMLAAVLSTRGVEMIHAVVAHERILDAIEREAGEQHFVRDPGLYAVTFFGRPGDEQWAWRLEGHHLSLNATIVGAHGIEVLPSFFGANPHAVAAGPHRGIRILGELEEAGHKVTSSMTPAQREAARVAEESPWDITTQNAPRLELGERQGFPAAEMSGRSREALRQLLAIYADRLTGPLAARETSAVGERFDELFFGWAGDLTPGEPDYYRIQDPTLLIEYANRQDGANHIHTVWRDAERDFGGL